MSEIKSLNGYALVDTNAREGIDALTEQIGGLSEEMGAVVKSVNGAMPDENGNVQASEPEKYAMFRSIKGETTVEAFGTEWLWGMADGSYSGNDLHMEHVVIDNNKGIVINYDKTGYEVTSLVYDNNSNPIQYIVKFYFGDNVCPVIVDLLKQEITLDPDWVASEPNITESAANTLVDTKISELATQEVSLPKSATGIDHGEAGQFAVSDGMGGIMWKTLFEAEEVAY